MTTPQIFTLLAIIPYALLMFPIIDHYNWKRPRNEKLVNRLLLFQKILLFIQIFFLIIATYLTVKQ
jgi:hypothetical protein